MYSATNLLGDGLTTELGGEFIDSSHTEILGLAKQFGLGLIDTAAASESGLIREAYLFGGSLRKESEIIDEFRQVAPRLGRDITAAASNSDAFDRISIEAYLDGIGATGWLRSMLDVAYRTEYGMDTGDQSAMNLLSLISPETSSGHLLTFGESDERYKIVGGNQRVADAVAGEVASSIVRDHGLESLRRTGAGFQLTFRKANTSIVEVAADVVILTAPFTILRKMELRVPLPASKLRAIRELGYGTNAKLLAGFHQRIWRDAGHSGNIFTDQPFQMAWDSSRMQRGSAGSMTMLLGGQAGVDLGSGTPNEQLERLLPFAEKAWPGLAAKRNGKQARFHWPTHPHTLGAYSCYRTGQWTTIRGHEGQPVGNLYFAGEHCSLEAQGFKEGAALTGRKAAEAILKRAGAKPARAA